MERNKVRDVFHSWRCQERRTGSKQQNLQPRFPLVSLVGGKGSIRKSRMSRAEKQPNFLLIRGASF